MSKLYQETKKMHEKGDFIYNAGLFYCWHIYKHKKSISSKIMVLSPLINVGCVAAPQWGLCYLQKKIDEKRL